MMKGKKRTSPTSPGMVLRFVCASDAVGSKSPLPPLQSPGLEDHHAALEFSDAEHSFVLRDFNTSSGSFVNDCQIQNVAVKVGQGDLLRFGSGGPIFELVLDQPPQVKKVLAMGTGEQAPPPSTGGLPWALPAAKGKQLDSNKGSRSHTPRLAWQFPGLMGADVPVPGLHSGGRRHCFCP